jgi:hypothetical protein
MTEPDVALTDYALTAECALFSWLIGRLPAGSSLRAPFALFFAASAVAALAGGTVHGFFLDGRSLTAVVLWRAALLAIGLSAYCGWTIGARLLLSPPAARRVQAAAAAGWAVYAAVIVTAIDRFWVAIANYAPAVVFLAVGLAAAQRRAPARPLVRGLLGLGLTVLAAIVQRLHIAVHPVFFNHNALYHLIQAAAFLLIFSAARYLVPSHQGRG